MAPPPIWPVGLIVKWEGGPLVPSLYLHEPVNEYVQEALLTFAYPISYEVRIIYRIGDKVGATFDESISIKVKHMYLYKQIKQSKERKKDL